MKVCKMFGRLIQKEIILLQISIKYDIILFIRYQCWSVIDESYIQIKGVVIICLVGQLIFKGMSFKQQEK